MDFRSLMFLLAFLKDSLRGEIRKLLYFLKASVQILKILTMEYLESLSPLILRHHTVNYHIYISGSPRVVTEVINCSSEKSKYLVPCCSVTFVHVGKLDNDPQIHRMTRNSYFQINKRQTLRP